MGAGGGCELVRVCRSEDEFSFDVIGCGEPGHCFGLKKSRVNNQFYVF